MTRSVERRRPGRWVAMRVSLTGRMIEHMELLRMDYQAFAERYLAEGRELPARECRREADRWERRQRRFERRVAG